MKILKNLLTLCIMAVISAASVRSFDLDRITGDRMVFVHEENYTGSIHQRLEWAKAHKGLRGSAGSISTDRFHFDLDVKLDATLLPALLFNYRCHHQESFIWDENLHICDLIYHPGNLMFGISGMPDSHKEHNLAGFLGGLDFNDTGHGVLRILWPDLWFNSKGPENQTYLKTPMEIHFEHYFASGYFETCGEWIYSRKWILKSNAGQQKQSNSTGTFIGCFHHFNSTFAVDFSYKNFHDEFLSSGDTSHPESLIFYKSMAEWHYGLKNNWTISARTGVYHAQGSASDPVQDERESLNLFDYRRKEILASLTGTRKIGNNHIYTGLIGSDQTIDTGKSDHYDKVKNGHRIKLVSGCQIIFNETATMNLELTYNASETRFGGGYLNLFIKIP